MARGRGIRRQLYDIFGIEPDMAYEAVERLTPTELRMAACIAFGYSNDDLRAELQIVTSTMQARRFYIRKKLNAKTIREIPRYYFAWRAMKNFYRKKEENDNAN